MNYRNSRIPTDEADLTEFMRNHSPESIASYGEHEGGDRKPRGQRIERIGLLVNQHGDTSLTIGQHTFKLNHALRSLGELAQLETVVRHTSAVALVVSVSETFGKEAPSKAAVKRRRD